MRIALLIIFIYFGQPAKAQLKIVSWNIENLGKSKSDSTLNYIAQTVKKFDIVAIQEVVAGYGGAQTIAKLADKLNRLGFKWNYSISDPTTSSAYKTERYAFIWQTAVVKKINAAWLEQKYNLEIDREPYYCTFEYAGKQITLVNFHAITKSKQPETEIKYFKFLPELYPNNNLIFLGDFNCPQSHTVFNPLKKMGYLPVFTNQKTSLKKTCRNNNCLASEFDNIWYNTSKIIIKSNGIIKFYDSFTDIKFAHKISDHIPIFVEIDIK